MFLKRFIVVCCIVPAVFFSLTPIFPTRERKNSMKKIACIVLCLLMSMTSCVLADTIIQRPDQYLTCRVDRGCTAERQPNTEIVSITKDMNKGIWSTFSGTLSFDHTGNYTVYMVEYDTDTDTTYNTTIHVTVTKKDPTVNWKWDKSANSSQLLSWIAQHGNVLAVGQKISFKHTCTIDGVEQKVVYSSNNPSVATVDSNGMVTLRSPGRASILMRADGTNETMDNYVIVYDGDPWTSVSGDFEPTNRSDTMNIYKQPSTSSTVIAVKKIYDSENFYIVSRGESWCKVSYNGKVGYAQTGKLTFYDGYSGSEALEETVPSPIVSEQNVSSNASVFSAQNASDLPLDGSSSGTTASNSPSSSKTVSSAKAANSSKPVRYTLRQLGTLTSKVTLSGRSMEIPTEDFFAASTVPKDKQIGVIYTPKEGSAALRRSASTSAYLTRHCKAGYLVQVLEYGSKFCKVVYDGDTGYVLTSSLRFVTPGTEPERTAKLSYNGKTNGSTAISVRCAPDKSSAKVGEWDTGTDVLIFGEQNGWYLIEARGRRGYVLPKYITLTDGE